jgi:CubicO group peptidase (beta-lactamase class C family)
MKLFFFALLFPVFLSAQTDSTDIIVKNMMKQQKIVGLSLAVIQKGEPTINKGYGLANAEFNVPASNETVFRLGSVSKQFFTAAILKLQEEDKLSIHDSVHRFFPDAPETWRPILLKHLMSHTSGLKRESPAYDNFKMTSDLDIIKAAYSLALDFKTGEKYQYCNLAYYMLAQIITQVSGQHWGKYIEETLFAPAGMSNSRMTDFYPIIPNRASGYMHKGDTLLNSTAMFAIRPSGGFYSTSTDMIKWDRVVAEKKIILKKESWEILWQPFIKTTNDEKSKSYYGFGWIISEFQGRKTVSHGGANIGFRSQYIRFVNDELSIIILTNTDEANPAAIGNALAGYYLSK